MKLSIYDSERRQAGTADLPGQFDEPVNSDLIKRAVLAVQANKRQPYGASPVAGKRQSAKLSRRRRNYKGSYGMGISRVPRKTMSRRGRRFMWTGAFAPGTVGGRRAHPPKAFKVFGRKINKEENRKAIRSALSASMDASLVVKRGHRIPDIYPFILSGDAESFSKTKQVLKALTVLGFGAELERTSVRTARAGKGKMRGRRYITKKGPLFVVSGSCPLVKSARNLTGVEVVEVSRLNAELLAPGTKPGRSTIFTSKAIERMSREGLFS
ncbi:50S ribosomal protein L4 [Candidatus Woesearchaeota archaeon]|nr:50S ribosomal protein L4 [Candidatus Woesearchaeota archaeon]